MIDHYIEPDYKRIDRRIDCTRRMDRMIDSHTDFEIDLDYPNPCYKNRPTF